MAGTARFCGGRTISNNLSLRRNAYWCWVNWPVRVALFFHRDDRARLIPNSARTLKRGLSEVTPVAIIKNVPQTFGRELFIQFENPAPIGVKRRMLAVRSDARVSKRGQVAQVVERSPEKAGVGGSTPSLATTFSITCTSRISLFGCNWLQFVFQLMLVPRALSLLTTRC